MKIYVYPADQTGCGHYRAIWPGEALRAAGHDVTVVPPNDGVHDLRAETKDGKIVKVHYPEDADVIVMQRVMHYWLAKAIPVMRASGVAVVVDIDDDLESIHPAHPAYAVLNPKWNAMYNWNVAREACRAATLVTVSTEPLRKMYTPLSGHCVVIKNTIPEKFLKTNASDEFMPGRTIGWMGSVHSHPDDLYVMGQTPARLQREGFPWAFVGPERGVQSALRFDSEPFSTGYVDMADIPVKIAETLGIGVAPLQDTRFNRAKSWLKALEYASLGVPSVCSDLPEYRALAQRTGALLARRPKDWYTNLKKLATDDALYDRLSQRARMAASDLTIEQHCKDWMIAWLNAYRLEQSQDAIWP